MNILILNGSPKGEHSNTLKLTNAFIDGYTQRGAANIDRIDINKLQIHSCKGCFACWEKTPGKCVMHDDMSGVLKKILQADIIIYSFPLYHFSLPSQLKMLIDRLLPMYLPFMDSQADTGGHLCRYDISGKQYVIISTCGFYTAEGNYTSVNAQFDKMYGKGNYTTLYCGQGELFRVPELKGRTEEYLLTVKAAGAEFAGGAITTKTKEKLGQLLFPRNVFEQMADASWGIEKDTQKKQKVEPSLLFTRQMAALYSPAAWENHDVVLEFYYIDIEKTYQIVLRKDGHTVLTENFLPYTTKIETPFSVWQKISRGEISGEQALMEHLYKVTGDFNIMLKWDEYFSGNNRKPEKKHTACSAEKNTNMTVMLLPWIALWIFIPISNFWGGITGILLCSALPFFFLKFKLTAFESVTIFAVSLISLLAVLGVPIILLIPLSYFAFGLMWFLTVFMKIPLSAWYSMKNYGGKAAFSNLLFLRTNRILTACWGVLYFITAVCTFFLLQTPLSDFTGIFNAAFPVLMGVFTVWFQQWYPKHYAAGSISKKQ